MVLASRLGIILTMCALLSNFKVVAQSSVNVGVDLSAGTNSFPINGRFGMGLSAEYLKTLTQHSGLRLYFGCERFNQRFPNVDRQTLEDSIMKFGIKGYNLSLLPLRFGYQYDLSKNGPSVYGEIGLSHVFTKYDNPKVPGNVFTYAIGIGYRKNVSSISYLQFGLSFNYNNLQEFGQRDYTGFKLAYGRTKYKFK